MLSKRVLSVVATGAVTASLLLAACGTSGGTSSQTVNYSGTLTIWHDWTGAYLTAKQKIVNEYEAAHPGVKITLVNQNDDTKTISSGQG